MKWIGEFIAYGLFAAIVGLLSIWPQYELAGEQQAIISVSLVHAGQRVGECRALTQEELNALPPNMRKPNDCPRERHPVRVELRSGGEVLYSATEAPTGLWSDGKSNVYERVIVNAGQHELFVGMSDGDSDNGFDYEISRVIDIEPGRNIVIRFNELEHRFRIQ
jgi:hypothetical protein